VSFLETNILLRISLENSTKKKLEIATKALEEIAEWLPVPLRTKYINGPYEHLIIKMKTAETALERIYDDQNHGG
jgi:hypothetical protein